MAPKTAFQSADISDLTGYVAIVTGGNSGIGYETSRQLALHHARVYIASRSRERVEDAIRNMKANSGLNLDLHFLELDLQDQQQIKVAATEFMKGETRLDLLINNAGIMGSPYSLVNGHELHWQTMVLGPHVLFNALLPVLQSTASACANRVRVVNVSSDAAFVWAPTKGIDYEDPNLTKETSGLGPWKRYGQAKLASIIQAKVINDKYEAQGITSYSLQPGIIKTNLQSTNQGWTGAVLKFMVHRVRLGTFSVEDGARTTLYCATSNQAVEHAGRYFEPFGKYAPRADKLLDNAVECKKLWDLCEEQTN